MESPETALPKILKRLLPVVDSDEARKVTAVRWFNRLYYDVEKWNREFVLLLREFPQPDDPESTKRLLDFDKRLGGFRDALEGRWTAEKWDLCCNLRMLSARFARDFAWLENEDQQCYWELRRLIDEAYGNENTIVDQAKRVAYQIRWARDRGESENQNIVRLIDSYVKDSREAIDELQRVAESARIQLLTVEQYEAALNRDGSRDTRLMVLGDVTMGHNVQVGNQSNVVIGATITNSNVGKVVQKISKSGSLPDAAKSELTSLTQLLSAALDKIRVQHADEVAFVESRLTELAKQLEKPEKKVNRGLLELTKKGLVDAAQTVAGVAPIVLVTAKKIADFLTSIWK